MHKPTTGRSRRAAGTVRRDPAQNPFMKAFKTSNVSFVGLNAPYADLEADVVLRSDDGVLFRLSSDALKGTSEAFRDMLDAPSLSAALPATDMSARSSGQVDPTPSSPPGTFYQPPIEIEAPAIIVRHFCDLLTDATLLPLDADARMQPTGADRKYETRTDHSGRTDIEVSDGTRIDDRLHKRHKRRLLSRKEQQPPAGDSNAASSSQHFTNLFRSPDLRGAENGIALFTILLDLLDRFACSPAPCERALGHYEQSIPHNPWASFVLFARQDEVERAKEAIRHFDKVLRLGPRPTPPSQVPRIPTALPGTKKVPRTALSRKKRAEQYRQAVAKAEKEMERWEDSNIQQLDSNQSY